jgi:hypothetical protein
MESPLPATAAVNAYQNRFAFLFPGNGKSEYKLFAPDLLELRWSVWSVKTKSTVAYGTSPEEAVDTAMERLQKARDAELGWTEKPAA